MLRWNPLLCRSKRGFTTATTLNFSPVDVGSRAGVKSIQVCISSSSLSLSFSGKFSYHINLGISYVSGDFAQKQKLRGKIGMQVKLGKAARGLVTNLKSFGILTAWLLATRYACLALTLMVCTRLVLSVKTAKRKLSRPIEGFVHGVINNNYTYLLHYELPEV